MTKQAVSFGHCTEQESDRWKKNYDTQHPPNGAVEPLFPFLKGLIFSLGPLSSCHGQTSKTFNYPGAIFVPGCESGAKQRPDFG
jgi:hypothetical protein